MKRLVLLLAAAALTVSAASATTTTEPLLLEPLSPSILSTMPAGTTATSNGVDVSVSENGIYDASYTTASQANSNMVPQNAAAEGKPVPQKREPRVRIQTKQRSQGNSYWNAGGKGTKSYF